MMGIAVLLVGYVGVLIGYETVEQHRLANLFAKRVPQGSVHDANGTSTGFLVVRHPHLPDGEPIAKLEMPSVHWDAIVTEGDDTGFLTNGPGHDDHTLYPGEGGMILFANHNGFSFSWNDLKVGDPIAVTMSYGRFHYRVARRYLIDGNDQTAVQRHFSGETLMVMTCWPLWQGAFAHQRLVFEAVPAT